MAPKAADAAQIGRGFVQDEIVLEGQIEPGDCRKLGGFAYRQGGRRLYLASPGGNLKEAIEIGRLVRALKFETIVPSRTSNEVRELVRKRHNLTNLSANYMCASACFFVFVAGVSRSADVGREPILGFHRPFLGEGVLDKLSGDQAFAAAKENKEIVEAYLKEMGVLGLYMNRMLSVLKEDISWISLDDYESDFDGVIPELRYWVDAKAKPMIEALVKESGSRMTSNQRTLLEFSAKRKVIDGLSDDAWIRLFGPAQAAASFCAP